MLLDKVYPAQEVVRIDYHIPGCPPSADTLWKTLTALLGGTSAELPYELIKYD
jgi:NAD-reducing hydrogenase small subunit